MFETCRTWLYDSWAVKRLFTARGNPNIMLTPCNDEPDRDLDIAMNIDDSPIMTFDAYAYHPVIPGDEVDSWFGNTPFLRDSSASPSPSDLSEWSSSVSPFYPSRSVSPISLTSTSAESLVSVGLHPCSDEGCGVSVKVEMDLAPSLPALPPSYFAPPISRKSSNSVDSDFSANHPNSLLFRDTGSPFVKSSLDLSSLHNFLELLDLQDSAKHEPFSQADTKQADPPGLMDFIGVKADSEADGQNPTTSSVNRHVSGLDVKIGESVSFPQDNQPQQNLTSHLELPNSCASTQVSDCTQYDGDESDTSFDFSRRRAAVVTMRRLKALSDVETDDDRLQLNVRASSSPTSKSSRSRKKDGDATPKTKSRRKRKVDNSNDTPGEDDWLARISQASSQEGGRYTFPDLNLDISRRTFAFSPLNCDLCMNRGFKRSHDLKRHLSAIHQLRNFHVCEVCETEFCRSDALVRHLAGGVCKGPGKKRKRRMMKWEVELARKERKEGGRSRRR